MLVLFALVMARMMGLLMGMPAFSQTVIPPRYKAAIAASLTFALLPTSMETELPTDAYAVLASMAQEFAFGFALGFAARLACDRDSAVMTRT